MKCKDCNNKIIDNEVCPHELCDECVCVVCEKDNIKEHEDSQHKQNIKDNCLTMINILNGFQNTNKDELKELKTAFDFCKEDLIKSLERE